MANTTASVQPRLSFMATVTQPYMRMTALLLFFMLLVMRPAAQPLLHTAAGGAFCPEPFSEL